MTPEQKAMMDEIAALRAANATLSQQVELSQKAQNGPLTIRKSPKGAVMVLGLGRWPVTLYQEQWGRLLDSAERIKAFIVANHADLKVKGADATEPAAPTA